MIMNNLVLVFCNPQRHMLVPNAGQHLIWVRFIRVNQHRSKHRDRRGQRFGLIAMLLIATIEQIGNKLRMSGEHLLVEHRRDVVDPGANKWKGGADHLGMGVGKPGTVSGGSWRVMVMDVVRHGDKAPYFTCRGAGSYIKFTSQRPALRPKSTESLT